MNKLGSLRRQLMVGTIVGGSVIALAGPALAQTAPEVQDDEAVAEIEDVIVTGSRIRRDPTNAPTPLIQVSREQLLETGRTTVIDYLAQLPALANSIIPSDTTGSNLGDGGLSFASLRSLGTVRTLTLVDGKRQVGSTGGSLSIDIDTIPRLLIENVEIVTGGASSIYGADAVSGVLNFILRKDFEGVEIDSNYGQINQGGEQTQQRVSALAGINVLDDRLNLYGFAEYELNDEIRTTDVDWLEDSWALVGTDADPTNTLIGPASDGILDAALFSNLRTITRPRWGQTTLANNQQPSPANDPDVPFLNPQCSGNLAAVANANCYSVDPTKTWVFEGRTARLADFGQRIGTTGANRTLNVGGDGENPAAFGQVSRSPRSESARYQVGANFQLTDSILARLEAKYVDENTFDTGQPVFFDVFMSDFQGAGDINLMRSISQFDLRISDNAFLPANLRSAILANTLTTFAAPSTTLTSQPGQPIATGVAAPHARHAMFGPDRSQDNDRTLSRVVGGLIANYDRIAFVDDVTFDLSYTFGEAENFNTERGVDVQRMVLAADAVVDTAGVVNGRPGEIVCRAQLLAAANPARTNPLTGFGGLRDDFRSSAGAFVDLRDSEEGARAVNDCAPLNIFGAGNQSEEALAYVDAFIVTAERNEQEQGVAVMSGTLWDFWGAGGIGIALGAEHRREFTSSVGRDAGTGDRFLFLNTGPDMQGVEYTSDELFAELSIPLFRDSWLGEFAELSGSWRTADYSTVGKVEVYGANLVYRPVQDLAFKTSFNTSVRVPNLAENFAPFTQTFANAFVDPCATAQINAPALAADIRTNRINNCTAQATAAGLAFDFAGATPQTTDDFAPVYASGIAGVIGGNPNLRPEESSSFTFSTILRPRFFPDLSLVLDYYEIEITDVIASVTAPAAAANCVSGTTLNAAACATIFRNNPTIPFGVGAPSGDPVGGFIQGSINYAKLKTRGLDFSARYSLDTADLFGHDFGRLRYSVSGLWLLDQQNFLNSADPTSFVEFASTQTFPRVRFNSTLTWVPNDRLRISWNMNWQTAQDTVQLRNVGANLDQRPFDTYDTGNFAVHDFTVNWAVNDQLDLRAGVTNAFDAEQPRYLGTAFLDTYDPYGTRFNIGLSFRPY